MSNELVAIARFFRAPEAHMAKAQLAEQGIEAQTTDEMSATLFSTGIEQIELLVRQADADRARDILGEIPPGGEAISS